MLKISVEYYQMCANPLVGGSGEKAVGADRRNLLLYQVSGAEHYTLKQSIIGEMYSLPSAHWICVMSVSSFRHGLWA